MKVAILAGGLGHAARPKRPRSGPKPMVEIGGRPILWHIMKHYAHARLQRVRRRARLQGRGHQAVLPRLRRAQRRASTCRPRGRDGRAATDRRAEDWTVHLVDTGLDDEHRRPHQAARAAGSDGETFMLTYGDGVADVDLGALLAFHRAHGQARHRHRRASAGALRRPGLRRRPGPEFTEKPQIGEGWINGGFFVARAGGLRLPRRRRHQPRDRTRSSGSRTSGSSWPTGTTASGSAWTRSATSALLEALWESGRRARGRRGELTPFWRDRPTLRHRRDRAGRRLARAPAARRRAPTSSASSATGCRSRSSCASGCASA